MYMIIAASVYLKTNLIQSTYNMYEFLASITWKHDWQSWQQASPVGQPDGPIGWSNGLHSFQNQAWYGWSSKAKQCHTRSSDCQTWKRQLGNDHLKPAIQWSPDPMHLQDFSQYLWCQWSLHAHPSLQRQPHSFGAVPYPFEICWTCIPSPSKLIGVTSGNEKQTSGGVDHRGSYLKKTIAVAAWRLGITGMRMVNTLEGRCVTTMVFTNPILEAIHLSKDQHISSTLEAIHLSKDQHMQHCYRQFQVALEYCPYRCDK